MPVGAEGSPASSDGDLGERRLSFAQMGILGSGGVFFFGGEGLSRFLFLFQMGILGSDSLVLLK